MVHAICTKKVRDSRGNIKSYVLQDIRGYCVEMTSADLKRNIAVNSIDVLNLQIDKAGRLVDKAMTNPPAPVVKTSATSFSDQDIKNFVDYIEHGKRCNERRCSDYEDGDKKCKVTYNYGYLSYDSDGYPQIISNDTSEKTQRALGVLNALVRQIVNHAEKNTIIQFSGYNIEYQVNFPKNVENIIQKIQSDTFREILSNQLFNIAGESPRIACVKGMDIEHKCCSILTNSYADTRKFLQRYEFLEKEIKKEKENIKVITIGMNLPEETWRFLESADLRNNNTKGNMFYAKYLAERLGFDIEYFKEKLVVLMINCHKVSKSKSKRDSIKYCLESGYMYANFYLALNNKVFQNSLGDTSKIDDRFYNQVIEDEADDMLITYGLLF